jgi:DnaJ family protein A protein 2
MSHNFNIDSDDFYEVLGISKDATERDIKKAFKMATLKFHPDKNPGKEKECEEKFKKIIEANSVLSDPEKKELYDKYGKQGLGEQGQMNPDDIQDILRNMFGNMGGFPFGMQGKHGGPFGFGGQDNDSDEEIPPVQAVVDLTLEELYKGKQIKKTIERGCLCKVCDGTGNEDKQNHVCETCKGVGMVTIIRQMGPMIQQMSQPCNKCGGKGSDKSKMCKVCNGNKGTTEKYDIECEIPAGAYSKYVITIPNEGNEIPNSKNNKRTDVKLIVREQPHNIFKHMFVIEGKKDEPDPADLLINLEVSLAESLCGFVKKINHLDGSSVNLSYNKLVKNGEIVIFPNLGMPSLENEKFGDLYVSITVNYPEDISTDKKGRLWQILTDTAYPAKSNKKVVEGISIDKHKTKQKKHHQERAQNMRNNQGQGVHINMQQMPNQCNPQ